jgi:hypothetical protein
VITLTRKEAQQVLDALEGSIDAQEWEINDHITKYGEWYRPKRVEYMKQQLANTNSTIETLRARLAQPEPKHRDVVIKGDLWRIEFLPDHAASVVLVRANYEAQPEPEPIQIVDGVVRPVPWTQREWQGLTEVERMDILDTELTTQSTEHFALAQAIEAKLKEKNCG